MRLRVGVWTILLCVILCLATITPVFANTVAFFAASDLANGWMYGRQLGPGYGSEYGAVLLTWERYSGTEASRIVGYEIWRDWDIRDIVSRNQYEFESAYYIDHNELPGIRVVEIEIDPVTGSITRNSRIFIPWRPDEEGNPTWEEFLETNEDLLGMEYSLSSLHYGWVLEGPVIGLLHYYRIRPIVLFQYRVGPYTYLWGLTLGEFTSGGEVIPVGPPSPIEAQVINSTITTFEFYSTFGADEAIIQVARDPGIGATLANLFLPERTLSQVISSLNPFDPDGNRVTVELDLAQVPGTGNIFWWRAGSRSRSSTYWPRPWPIRLADPDYGWVWSNLEWLKVGHFSDVSPGHWAFSEVEAVQQAEITLGYPDGTYRPTYPVTRDQMAVYISRAMAGGDGNVPGEESYPTPSFEDVPVNHWAYRYIGYAVDREVVRGYEDGLYHSDDEVDRGQMAVYIARAAGWVNIDEDMSTAPELFPDVPEGFWSGTAIEACLNNGVVRGYLDGYCHPEWTVTRDQMAVYITRGFDLGI